MAHEVVLLKPNVLATDNICPFKLVLLGDSMVGKSSLVLRLVKDQFYDYIESTIGAAFITKKIQSNNGTVKFEIWDTAGQERYHSLTPMYYRSAHAAVVVYDITNEESFERAKYWVKELRKHASSDIVIALAGNKLDLNIMRRIDFYDSQTFAHENELIFMETSAKTNDNITEIFKAIAEKLPKNVTLKKIEPFRIRNYENLNNTSNCCK